jgi:hypothetical protein
MHERMQANNKMPLPSFLRTHPPTLERADATLAQFDTINDPPRKDLYIGTKNLQRRIPRSEKEFPE